MEKRHVDPEVRIAELEAEVARLTAILDDQDEPLYPPEYAPVDPGADLAAFKEELRAKGVQVGTLTGPPIVGTRDTINSGPAKPR